MDLKRIRTIAIKETHDHITSHRFIALLFLLMALSGIYMLRETGIYLEEVSRYANNLNYFVSDLPYTLNIFGGIRTAIGGTSIFGSIIAIALGFDLITKERESGSIKVLLSVPMYRDEAINGKALGGIISLSIATSIVFVFASALLLIQGIVPGLDELSYLFAFWIFTILYLSGIFIMSMMVSTFAKTSGLSFIYSLLILLLLTSVISATGVFATKIITGPEPAADQLDAENPDFNKIIEEAAAYHKNKSDLIELTTYMSISSNYHKLSQALTRPQDARMGESDYANNGRSLPPIGEVLGAMWGRILILITYPALFFGIAYVGFMRMDLR